MYKSKKAHNRVISFCISFTLFLLVFSGSVVAEKDNAVDIKLLANYRFEDDETNKDWVIQKYGRIITDKNEVISGKASLKGDSIDSTADYHTFFTTNTEELSLKKGEQYTISFNYKILNKQENTKFFFCVFLPPNTYKNWILWSDEAGYVGSKTIYIKHNDIDNYRIILGIQKQGSISIDDFKVYSGKPEETTKIKSPLESYVISATTNNKNNIFYPGDEIKINVLLNGPKIKNVDIEALVGKQLVLKSEIVDFYGKKIKEDTSQFIFGKDKAVSEIKVKLNELGYYWTNLSFRVEEQEIKQRIGIAVIPPSLNEPKLDFDSPFGMNLVVDTNLGNIVGTKWDRPRGFGWGSVEKTKGTFLWNFCDVQVDKAYKAGINIMAILSSPPAWARKIPKAYKESTDDEIHTGWADFPPNDLEAWGKYVYEIVNRYKDRIKVWEIWNEPWPAPADLFFKGGTIQDYVDLLKVAYQQAKKADPSCIIVGLGGTEYKHMRSVFEAGGFDYMDAASIHHYQLGENPPEAGDGWLGSYLDAIKKARKVLNDFGKGKEKDLWITEIGWSTNITTPSLKGNQPGISEELQAKYLPRTNILGLANGVDKIFWFMFFNMGNDRRNYEHNTGILYGNYWAKEDLTPKPAFVAYATMTRMLEGLDYKGELNLGDAVYGYEFEKGNKSCFVLWCLSEGITLKTPSLPDGIKMVDMMGAERRIEKKNGKCYIPLSDSVIYLSSDKGNGEKIKKILEAEPIEGISPIIIKSQKTKRLDDNRMLMSIEIQSKIKSEINGEVELQLLDGWDASPVKLSFGPIKSGESKEIGFIISREGTKDSSTKVSFAIMLPDGKPIKGEQRIDLPVIKKISPPNIDADLSDWNDINGISLSSIGCVVKMNGYKDEDDLSGDVRIAWDDNDFYLAAEIRDDVFNQPFNDVEIWKGDGIQFAISTFDNRTSLYEYGISLTTDGPELYCWTAPQGKTTGLIKNANVMVKRTGNNTIYEVAIPWKELNIIKPETGNMFSFSFLVNDNDGDGRKGWIEYAGGIGDKKDTSIFATCYFGE